MLNNNDFGTKIADLRKDKGLTQAQLADLLNISNKTVSRWETGEGYPEITLLAPLARALGVTVDELLAEPREERNEDDSHNSHNNGSKPKKHKEIPIEWPEFNFKDIFRRPMVIINVLQIAFFIIFYSAAFSCGNYGSYFKDEYSSVDAFMCTAKVGYTVMGIMLLSFIVLILFYITSYRFSRIGRQLMIRNIIMSAFFTAGIIICYSPFRPLSYNTSSIFRPLYKSEYWSFFFSCDFFKVDRQLINYVFWGVVLIYLILEIIRIKLLKKEQKKNSDISESKNTFWKSLTIFNKIGFVCMMVCIASPFVSIIITVVTQSFIISLTESAVAVTPAIMLTFITILPKIGLIIAAIGLILGACDLYDRQYKASIIIIGANIILPYIISFLSVILYIYPYQTLFN
ncbi:MAG: helix-turn-helix domain-containing protein [Anaerovoracaceae bacterium]